MFNFAKLKEERQNVFIQIRDDPTAYTISIFFSFIPTAASYANLKKRNTPAEASNIPFIKPIITGCKPGKMAHNS